jgi:hypothetical protein
MIKRVSDKIEILIMRQMCWIENYRTVQSTIGQKEELKATMENGVFMRQLPLIICVYNVMAPKKI